MITKVFHNMGAFLVEKLKLDQPEKGDPGLKQEVLLLATEKKAAVKNYYIDKVSAFLMTFTVGMILSAVVFGTWILQNQDTEVYALDRPGYGGNERTEELSVSINGQKEEPMEVTIQARQYSEAQKKELLRAAREELKTVIVGDNASMQEIRTDLVFPQELQNGAVTVSWMTNNTEVISYDGSVNGPDTEEGIEVEIEATLVCDQLELIYKTTGIVFAPLMTSEEILRQEITRAVEQADEEQNLEATISLPDRVLGNGIHWRERKDNPARFLFLVTLIAAAAIWIETDAKVHKMAKKRKEQLLLDYPDLMWKMTMLLGAGLSIKGTFYRIAAEYKQKVNTSSNTNKKEIRYVYEEIVVACYEMKSGIAEADAYERFGRRCDLPEYIRLGSVLSQNLKKGSSGIIPMLTREAESSLNDRKSHARAIGEQAGTKMLFPMMLMLVIVLVVIMVPAVLTF